MQHQIKSCSITNSDLYAKLCVEAESGSYTAYLRGKRCKTEDTFFSEISASFQFPYYYGENWPATDECLCDLEWLGVPVRVPRIFIAIDDFRCMFFGQEHMQSILQNRVIQYFSIMVECWKGQGVSVEVWLNN